MLFNQRHAGFMGIPRAGERDMRVWDRDAHWDFNDARKAEYGDLLEKLIDLLIKNGATTKRNAVEFSMIRYDLGNLTREPTKVAELLSFIVNVPPCPKTSHLQVYVMSPWTSTDDKWIWCGHPTN